MGPRSEGPGWKEDRTEREYNEMGLGDSQELDYIAQASETMISFVFVLEAI